MFRKDLQVEKNAVSSLFKILSLSLLNHNIPEEAGSWLKIPEQCWSPKRQRQITDEEISTPAAKRLWDHKCAKQKYIVHLPPKKHDPEIINMKQKSKIRNLHQITKIQDDKIGRHCEQFYNKINKT